MIRINLLPASARRRRRRQPAREGVVLGAMSLGWIVLITVGYLWIAATEAEVADLRRQARGVAEEVDRVETGQAALVRRQDAHRARLDALQRLQAARRSPAPWLRELAVLVAGDPATSPFASDPSASPRLTLTSLQADGDGRWRVAGEAADLVALTDLVRRLQASPRVASVAPAEYARTGAGRLAFRLEVSARE